MYPGLTTGQWLTIVESGDQPPPAGMSGPANTPTFDVFGSWTVTRLQYAGADSCPNTTGPRPTEDSSKVFSSKPDSPPPSPGWPVSAP